MRLFFENYFGLQHTVNYLHNYVSFLIKRIVKIQDEYAHRDDLNTCWRKVCKEFHFGKKPDSLDELIYVLEEKRNKIKKLVGKSEREALNISRRLLKHGVITFDYQPIIACPYPEKCIAHGQILILCSILDCFLVERNWITFKVPSNGYGRVEFFVTNPWGKDFSFLYNKGNLPLVPQYVAECLSSNGKRCVGETMGIDKGDLGFKDVTVATTTGKLYCLLSAIYLSEECVDKFLSTLINEFKVNALKEVGKTI